MKKLSLFVILVCMTFISFSQEEAKKPDYAMAEDVYVKAKAGMEDDFEKAVKAHNEKFHSTSPHEATLYSVATGRDAGWYIWEMGPGTYTDLDSRPSDDAHDQDWENTVGPYVQKYGRVEYWRYNDKLSYRKEGENYSKWTIWYLDVKRGEWYRFESFMEKVKAINEKMGDSFSVWTNNYSQADGRGVSFAFPFDKWADLDADDWNMKEEYEKEYGEGSWTNALKEWQAVTSRVVSEVWVEVK